MNPFLNNYVLKVIDIYKTNSLVQPNDVLEGVVARNRLEIDKFTIEQQQKVGVYYVPFAENILYKDMTAAGRDLLLYLIYNIKEDTDYINIKLTKVSKEMSISRRKLVYGIASLIHCGIICKKAQSEYWVNINYIFKGNRLNYIKQNCPDCIKVIATKGTEKQLKTSVFNDKPYITLSTKDI